jgi:hypothetical protein
MEDVMPIQYGKFGREPPAMSALAYAIVLIGAVDKFYMHGGKPGEVIESMSTGDRERLKELKSEMMFTQRFEPWMLYRPPREQITLHLVKEFHEEIGYAIRHKWSRRLRMRYGVS